MLQQPFEKFTKFRDLKKAFGLQIDLDIGKWGPTYLCAADTRFLVKHYKGRAGVKFLPGFVSAYENAIAQLANEDIQAHIQIVPFLHSGVDFIVKPWIKLMYPATEIKAVGDVREEFSQKINLINTKIQEPNLKQVLLCSAEKGTTFFDYKNSKLLYTDLDFG